MMLRYMRWMRSGRGGMDFMPNAPMMKRASGLLCAAALLLCSAASAWAVETQPAAVSGNFVYTRSEQGDDAAKISYRVEPANYHGIDAWRISWSDTHMDAVHYIRRSDGAPLYTRRVNRVHPETVEIDYSLDPAKPTVYRRETRDETLVRRIRQRGLVDMGSLPQMLAGMQAAGKTSELHFSAIDYSNGQVYALVAKRIGYMTLTAAGRGVPCAVYEANLDSWRAAFSPAMRLQLPTSAGLANFSGYSGPDPDGSGKLITLRMRSSNLKVAMLRQPANAKISVR